MCATENCKISPKKQSLEVLAWKSQVTEYQFMGEKFSISWPKAKVNNAGFELKKLRHIFLADIKAIVLRLQNINILQQQMFAFVTFYMYQR